MNKTTQKRHSGYSAPRSRWWLIVKRWVEVTSYGLFAAALFALLMPLAWPYTQTKFGAWRYGTWIYPSLGVILLVVALALFSSNPLRRLPFTWAYLPAWLGSLVGFAALLTFWRFFPGSLDDAGAPTWLRAHLLGIWWLGPALLGASVVPIVLVPLGCHFTRQLRAKAKAKARASQKVAVEAAPPVALLDFPFKSFEAMVSWFTTDDEVQTRAEDLGRHTRTAERIAAHLRERKTSIALLGDYGTGKTTIRELVARELEREPIRIVPMSLWPFDSPEAGARGVLDALIEAFSCYVNPLPLRGLGAAYAHVIEGSSGWLSGVTRGFAAANTPSALIKRMNDVACAIKIRFVVWVEDLERFAGESDVPERLAPIKALLYLMNQEPCLSVVIATHPEYRKFDIDKLAQHVEEVPGLPAENVFLSLHTFHAGCRAQFGDLVPAPTPEAAPGLDFSDEGLDRVEAELSIATNSPSIETALIALCPTPRKLKHALRACHALWGKLHGEINFDDVMVLSFLKLAEPDAFEFINACRVDLQNTLKRHLEDKEQTLSLIEKLRSRQPQFPPDRMALVEAVTKFLFPESRHHTRSQSVISVRPRDYFFRFLELPELGKAERDQPVIRAVQSFDAGKVLLTEQLYDEQSDWGPTPIEDFGGTLAPTQLLALLEALLKRAHDTPNEWPRGTSGLLVLARMLRHMRGDNRQETLRALDEIIRTHLETSVRDHLALALEIVSTFHWLDPGTPEGPRAAQHAEPEGETAARTEGTQGTLRGTFLQAFERLYLNDARALVRVLTGAYPGVLVRACFDSESTPFPEWPRFASTVLEAAQQNRHVMLPQVAGLLTNSTGPQTFALVRDAVRLFEVRPLQQVFQGVDPAEFDEETQLRVRAVQAGLHHPGLANQNNDGDQIK